MAAESISTPLPMRKNTTYLKLLSAQVISLIGTGISSLTLALLAWELEAEDASAVLGTAFALKMIAYVGLAPVFGAIAHKLPRKQFMFALDIIRAGLILCLPFVTQSWQIYVLVFVINACSAGFTPLFQSTLPQILPDKDQYVRALSYSRMAYDLEQIISPLLTAMLLLLIGFRDLFILDACTFVLSGVLIISCTLPAVLAVDHGKGVWNNLKFGIQSYLATPRLRALWIAYLAAAGASAMVIVNTVVYVNQILEGGDRETALAMAVVGFGSMLIALKLPAWLEKRNIRPFMLIGGVSISLALFLGTLTPSWPGFVAVCLLLGIGMSCIQTPAGVLVTRSCKEADAPAFFAAHFSLTHLWWLLTYLLAGWSSAVIGLSMSYLLMGALCTVSLLMVSTLFPRKD